MNNSEEFRRQCEARYVLKMDHEKRDEFYRGARIKRGPNAVNELIKEVKKQEAQHVLKLDHDKRQEYYQVVLQTRGKGEVNALLAAVKQQRRIDKSQEMAA